ncbi:hypothetical protein [Microbacterium sp. NPDC058389]|uniref:hypothetical protein n=1 Tax=Microbacterium sp. NPDC058389 TaxID=3346475 RepID=UPI00364D3D59
MATTTQHINARSDVDLQERFIAVAEQRGIGGARQWVQQNMGQLVTAEVDGAQTVADVHAYAKETRDQYIAATAPPPGLNLGAVTDTHLATAITAVHGEGSSPA